MRGFEFSKFKPNEIPKGGFEELLKLFLELLELYELMFEQKFLNFL